MFYVTVNFMRYGFKVETREEAEKLFNRACAEYTHAYVVLNNANDGRIIKERICREGRQLK